MKDKFFFFFFFFFLMSCSATQKQQGLPLDGEYYIIDLDEKKDPSILLSSLFKNIRAIILETNEDCLIGQIDELQVFDGYIYILDSKKAKSLFVFDMDGRFIRKIGSLGSGPGEYIQLLDFTLDTENRFIYLLDYSQRVHKYYLDGTFDKTITPKLQNAGIIYIQYYNSKLYMSVSAFYPAPEDFMLQEIDIDNGQILSKSLPLKYNKGWNETVHDHYSRFFMSRANNPPRYNQMFMNFIVSIGKEITPYIELKSKNWIKERDIEDFHGKNGMQFNMANIINSPKIFNVHCYVENEDFICFRCGMVSSFVVIIYKKTGEVKLANYLSNDLIYRNDQRGMLGRFIFSDAKGVYDILDTQYLNMLNDFQNAIKNNEIIPDLDKLDQLMKLNEDANPIIFYYEYK